jgi:hypothetical protein
VVWAEAGEAAKPTIKIASASRIGDFLFIRLFLGAGGMCV